MAHAIETMMSVKETPWHGLGKVLTSAPSIPDAMVQSGLDWEVKTHPVEYRGKQYADMGQIVTRQTDGKVLGCVGPGWHPLQNAAAFEWFAPFLDAGLATLETAGSLHGGRVVWVMARLAAADVTIGSKTDAVRPFLLLSNSHNGSAAIRVGFTPVRVVCHNTLSLAHRNKGSALLRVKHTRGLTLSLSAVRDTVDALVGQFHATAEQWSKLAACRISKADVLRYVTLVLAQNPAETTKQEDDKIETAMDMAVRGRGNTLLPHSLWTAYNGVTEYLSWAAGRTQDTRLDSLWFGRGRAMNDYALDVAVQLAV